MIHIAAARLLAEAARVFLTLFVGFRASFRRPSRRTPPSGMMRPVRRLGPNLYEQNGTAGRTVVNVRTVERRTLGREEVAEFVDED